MKTTDPSPSDRPPAVTISRTNRSRITNGKLWPRGLDGRSAEARRWRDLYREFAAQTPPGAPSAAREARLRSLVGVTVALERVGSRQARGESVDHAELVSLANSQGRLMQELGLAPRTTEPAGDDPAACLARIRDADYWKGGAR